MVRVCVCVRLYSGWTRLNKADSAGTGFSQHGWIPGCCSDGGSVDQRIHEHTSLSTILYQLQPAP